MKNGNEFVEYLLKDIPEENREYTRKFINELSEKYKFTSIDIGYGQIKPVAWVDYSTKEWFGIGNGLFQMSLTKTDYYKYPLYTIQQNSLDTITKLESDKAELLKALTRCVNMGIIDGTIKPLIERMNNGN